MNIKKGLLLFVICAFSLHLNLNPILLVFCMSFVCFILLKKLQVLENLLFKEREVFIKTLNHDLRVASLAQIRALDILEKSSNGVQKDFIKDINESCKFSLDMITNLLNTFKLKNGEMALYYEAVNLSELVEEVCESNKFIVKSDKTITINSCDNVVLDADKHLLYKAFSILLSFAFACSCAENIDAMITKKNNQIVFELLYDGVNLENEKYIKKFGDELLFSTVGYGIKMELCKKIIEFHGGKMVFDSQSNKNKFTIKLPISKVEKSSTIALLTSVRQTKTC